MLFGDTVAIALMQVQTASNPSCWALTWRLKLATLFDNSSLCKTGLVIQRKLCRRHSGLADARLTLSLTIRVMLEDSASHVVAGQAFDTGRVRHEPPCWQDR